jgi:iron complex transport system permease protein
MASARSPLPDVPTSIVVRDAGPPTPSGLRRVSGLSAGLVALALLAAGAALANLVFGSRTIAVDDALTAVFGSATTPDQIVVEDLRLPRTAIALAVGASLGLAGGLMQAVTRNPLADPGLLGVNAGTSLAVVIAIFVFDLGDPSQYIWFAIVGAAAASAFVFAFGAVGRAGSATVRLALAGAALTALCTSYISVILLIDETTFDQYRFWVVGSVGGRGLGALEQVVPMMLVGLVVGLVLAPALNVLALGEDTARALGARVGSIRAGSFLAVTMLCAAAVSVAGPIIFVGLAAPHAARLIAGPDHRWLLPYAALIGAALVLVSDVLGRTVAQPREIQAGIVMTILGGPLLIVLVRRHRGKLSA